MPITYDISTDGLYLQGKEDFTHQLVKNALINKEFTIEQIARIINVSLDYIQSVQKEIDNKE